MLTLEKSEKNIDVSIEIDPYVPLSVLAKIDKVVVPYYWRGGDGRRSLLEIGVHRKTGMFVSATLVLIDPEKLKISKEPIEKIFSTISGLPVFNLSFLDIDSDRYADSFIDDFSETFSVTIGPSYLCINFDSSDNSNTYLKCGRLRFGFADDKLLSSLIVLGLSPNELRSLAPGG